MPYKYVRLRRLALFSLITGLFALGAALLARIPAVAETFFAKGISRAYITAVGYVTSALPFSLFELLVALAVVLAAVTLGRWICWGVRHKKLKILQSFLRVVAVVMTVVAVYVLTATCNYHRAPVEDVPAADLSADELEDAANLFLADFNALAHTVQRDSDGKLINPYGFQGLCDRIRAQYQTLGDYYNSFTPTPKKLLFSDVVSAFGIIGISFQPTAEANINTNTPDGALPPLIAHELAHNKGVMREGDANLIAAYLTLTSDDPYLRYTGYLDTFGDSSVFGKKIGGDIVNNKKSWLLTRALEKSGEMEKSGVIQQGSGKHALLSAMEMKAANESEKNAKIARVKEIYTDLGIDEDAKYEIIKQHANAMDYAGMIGLPRVRYEILHRYAEKLLGRTR